MNQKNIEKIRKNFILVASFSFFTVMLLMGGVIYAVSFLATQSEIRATLDYIIENDGDIKRNKVILSKDPSGTPEAGTEKATPSPATPSVPLSPGDALKRLFGVGNWMHSSAEFPYSIRYFAVLYDKKGNIEDVKTSHIAAVEKEAAEVYAGIALDRDFSFGRIDDYYYKVAERKKGGKIVVYVESLRQMNATDRILYIALVLIGFGSIITLLLVLLFSKRIVKGEIRRNEMQDRFLTNASHELKTPLAVIKANTEVEQMLSGENEWNQSTMQQVERMTELIGNLIRIVRAEEKENGEPPSMIHVSEIVRETADTFKTVASQEKKELLCHIDADIVCLMRETDIRQLMSLFLDNAIKYCDEEGTIEVSARAKGKTLRLSVSNDYAEGEKTDYGKFFERFYRKDESHNIEKGGYGIGLSIAENIVQRYKGTIRADWKDGVITFTCTFHMVKQKGEKHREKEGLTTDGKRNDEV